MRLGAYKIKQIEQSRANMRVVVSARNSGATLKQCGELIGRSAERARQLIRLAERLAGRELRDRFNPEGESRAMTGG